MNHRTTGPAPRPTLRCLRDDLKLSPGTVDDLLDEVDHVLMAKVREQFADRATPHERIAAVKSLVLFKAKVQRWRGAVWVDPSGVEPAVWLIAAGTRAEGSSEDFYCEIACIEKAGGIGALLPEDADRNRYLAESAERFRRQLSDAVILLCRRSLLDAGEHSADVEGAVLGVQVRRDSETHLTYVAIRVIGSWSDRLTAVVLNLVPGCDPAAWFPEYAMPERPPAPAEQIWSNVMDPEVAVKLMGDSGHGPL